MPPLIDALASVPRAVTAAPKIAEIGGAVPKIAEVARTTTVPQALAGGIEAGLNNPHATLGHLATLKEGALPPPTLGSTPISTEVPHAAAKGTPEASSPGVNTSPPESGVVDNPTQTSNTSETTGKAASVVDPNEKWADAGKTTSTTEGPDKPVDPNEKWTEAGSPKDTTNGEGSTKAESGDMQPKTPEASEREQQVQDAEAKGEAAFEAMANGTPEEAERAIAEFQEAANHLNGITEKLNGNHRGEIKKAVSELFTKDANGNETQEATELRMRLQSMMQTEAQLMVYRQQLEQIREQYNKTRDKLRSVDQWWNRAVYDKDPKKRMEKYQLYSQLIGLQEIGKRILNTVHEAKAVYAKNISILNSRLHVHGILGTMADYIVAKGYRVNASARENSDWLTEKMTGSM